MPTGLRDEIVTELELGDSHVDLTAWLGNRYQPDSFNRTVSFDSGIEQLKSLQYQNSSWTVGSEECEFYVEKSSVSSLKSLLESNKNDSEFDNRLQSRRASLSNLIPDSNLRKLSRNLSVNIPSLRSIKSLEQTRDLRREVLNYNFHERLKRPSGVSDVPKIVIAELVPVAKNTSSILKVELVRCDCEVCGSGRSTALGKFVEKMFDTYIANRNCRTYYWDENNGREMYECLVRVFRMLVGLWLRHHNHGKVT